MMKYIANDNFILKEVAEEFVLMPRGATAIDFSAMVVFNETGILLFNALKEKKTAEELAQILQNEYGISFDVAKNDVDAFIAKSVEEGFILSAED